MLRAIGLRLLTFALLWLTWILGSMPWESALRAVASADVGALDGVYALGGVALWTGLVVLTAGTTFGLHISATTFALAELTLGLRADGAARWRPASRQAAIYDLIAAALLIGWGARELDAASTDARFFGGMTLGVGVYFAVAGLAQLLALRRRAELRSMSEWESHSLTLVSLTVAAFATLSVAGLGAARAVDVVIGELRHVDAPRPLYAGERVRVCTITPCQGRRAFMTTFPPSGLVYVELQQFSDCDSRALTPEGAPLLTADGAPVEFELLRFGGIDHALWLEGAPGSDARFAVDACAHAVTVRRGE
ncbi:MAG: hypothetical protein H6713_25300 [Myxococcales bacterium]|nr:hypothetical protein [Myxococcales bacterium]